VTRVKIYMCIDVDASDMAILLMIARQEGMPVDAVVKKAIAQYVAPRLVSLGLGQSAATTAGGEK
jgi:hypothetical protein